MTNNTLTTTQAAKILNCAPETARRLCQDGELKAQKVNQQWNIDETHCREYAKTYVASKTPWRRNKDAFDVPVGNGHKTKRRARPVQWSSVDEQIEATLAGKVRPLYLTAAGEVIK